MPRRGWCHAALDREPCWGRREMVRLRRDPARRCRRRAPPIRPPDRGAAVEHRDDRERDQSTATRPGSLPPAAGRYEGRRPRSGRREERDEDAGQRHRRLEHEQELRPVVLRSQSRIREEQRKACREQPGQDDLTPQPGLEVGTPCFHLPLVGRSASADKEPVAARILVVDDHPSRARRLRRFCARTASSSPAKRRTATKRSRPPPRHSPISSCSTS